VIKHVHVRRLDSSGIDARVYGAAVVEAVQHLLCAAWQLAHHHDALFDKIDKIDAGQPAAQHVVPAGHLNTPVAATESNGSATLYVDTANGNEVLQWLKDQQIRGPSPDLGLHVTVSVDALGKKLRDHGWQLDNMPAIITAWPVSKMALRARSKQ
jgi:hypothetical protein